MQSIFTIDNLTMVIPIIILTISQIIMLMTGNTDKAKSIEIKKEKQINRLMKKRLKAQTKFMKTNKEIEKLVENKNNE